MQIGGKHFQYGFRLLYDGIEFGEDFVFYSDNCLVSKEVTQLAAKEKLVIEIMQELFIAVL
jgi:hypothetical protein